MSKKFYSHIISLNSLIVELDKMGMSESEKSHLLSIIDSSVEHAVLDAILSELSPADKKLFVEQVIVSPHDKIWEFLNTKVDQIEDKIRKTAEELKKELHEDIDEAKQRNR